MPFRSGSVGPRTIVGQWLRATLLLQTELRDRLKTKLNGGKAKGWNDDEPAVIEAACELAVGRFFGTSYDVRAITELAHNRRYDQQKTEAVIRSALGEQDVDTEGIATGQKYLIRGAVVTLVYGKLRLSEAALDQLITDAEKIAIRRGWNPALAD